MRKFLMLLILLAGVVLSACGQASGGEQVKPTADAAAETSATSAPVDPAVPTEAAPTSAPAYDASAKTMACEVVSINPTPGPTQASMFPPVSEEDWVLGNATNPILTITEYSDFQ